MSTMPSEQIDPIEAWNNLVEWADDAEYAALEAMSPEEIEAKLVSIGYYDDVRGHEVPTAAISGPNVVADASGPHVVAHAEEDAPPSNVVPLAPRRRVKILGLSPMGFAGYAAAATAAGLIAARALGLLGHDEPSPAPHPRPSPSATPENPPVPESLLVASQLRDDARDACLRQDWNTCLGKINRARDLDPASDAVYGASLRASALAGLEHVRKLQEEQEKKSPK
jgi:hypothetical protein